MSNRPLNYDWMSEAAQRSAVGHGYDDAKRTAERHQGCWNCTAWESGPACIKFFEDFIRPAEMARITEAGEQLLNTDPNGRVFHRVDDSMPAKMIKSGSVGLCMKSAVSQSQLTQFGYLCSGWSGRTGYSLAKDPGAPLDPLPAELKDKRGLDQ